MSRAGPDTQKKLQIKKSAESVIRKFRMLICPAQIRHLRCWPNGGAGNALLC